MPEKILIVDDDSEFREELRQCLEQDYDIQEARNGQEALDIFKKANEIDLVILDVRMPGMYGTDVLEALKKNDPDIGIIILTGHSSKDTAIEALKRHADDYVEKPPKIDELKESIEGLLEKKRGETSIEAADIDGKIEKIKRFTKRNCYKKISLNDVAQVVYLSPKYLSRVFKERTGKSFSQFRIGIKINEAKKLLVNTGYNINQISEKLGYENTESFIRQFKKLAGFTPTEFRNKAKRPKRKK